MMKSNICFGGLMSMYGTSRDWAWGWAAEQISTYDRDDRLTCPVCKRQQRARSALMRHVAVTLDKEHQDFVQNQRMLALECWESGLTTREAAASAGMWFGYDWIARFWRTTFGEATVDERYRKRLAESVRQAHCREPDFNSFSKHRQSAGYGKANPFFGKRHSEAARMEMSRAHQGKTISDEQKRKFHESHRRRYPTPEAYSAEIRARYEAHPEAKEKIREARLRQRFSRRSTKPERLFRQLLVEIGIEAQEQIAIPTCGIVDFMVGSLILEVYGDYWHANPAVYGSGRDRLNEHQRNQRRKDAARNERYRQLGYRVEIFWESEIIRETDAARMRLVAILEERTP